jgi:phosphoenolpyruvate carboxykinase (ATP)
MTIKEQQPLASKSTRIDKVRAHLETIGLINIAGIVHNPSYDALFEAETDDALSGFEKSTITDSGAVNVDTGIYTGRSPKDKFLVKDDTTKDTVWWKTPDNNNDNKPI